MYRITTQYSGTKVSLGFPPSSSLTQGILQINHHVNPLARELWAVGKQEGNVEMGLGDRRKPWMRNEGWTHRRAAHRQDGSSRERRGVSLEMWGQGWSFQNNERWTGKETGFREVGKGKKELNAKGEKQKGKRKLCSNYGWWWEAALWSPIGPLQTYKVFAPRIKGWMAITIEAFTRPDHLPPRCSLIDNEACRHSAPDGEVVRTVVDPPPLVHGCGRFSTDLLAWGSEEEMPERKGRNSLLSIFTGILFHCWCVCARVCLCLGNMM